MKIDYLECSLYREDLERIRAPLHEKLHGKTIMITGGTGLIGSAFSDYLIFLNRYYGARIKIIISDLNPTAFHERFDPNEATFLYYDVTEPLPKPLPHIDYVVHCGGIASPKAYDALPVETAMSHLNGTLELLRYSKEHEIEGMLYVSSSEIYGLNMASGGSKETDYGVISIDENRSSYAIAKKMAERFVKAFATEYGVRALIVRPGHIFGPTASIHDSRVSSQFCYLASKGDNLVLKSSGSQVRSYCYVLDCVAAMLYVLLSGEKGESYNIGSKEKTTICEMAHCIAEYAQVSYSIVSSTTEEQKTFNPMIDSSLDSSKLERLGFSYKFDANEGFSHTIDILRYIARKKS